MINTRENDIYDKRFKSRSVTYKLDDQFDDKNYKSSDTFIDSCSTKPHTKKSSNNYNKNYSKQQFSNNENIYNKLVSSKSQIEENSIFKKLCPQEKFQTSKNCQICDKERAKILGNLRFENCNFCGKYVCQPCISKKRKVGFSYEVPTQIAKKK